MNDLEQVTWCADVVRRHLDWLMADPEHADQLIHDLEAAGSWQAIATPDRRGLTIECRCGDRVAVDYSEIMRCRTCEQWGLLSWWVEQEQLRSGPVTLRQAQDLLLVQQCLDVGIETLRRWTKSRDGSTPPPLLPVPWVAVVNDEAKRYDMTKIADHALKQQARRVRAVPA